MDLSFSCFVALGDMLGNFHVNNGNLDNFQGRDNLHYILSHLKVHNFIYL